MANATHDKHALDSAEQAEGNVALGVFAAIGIAAFSFFAGSPHSEASDGPLPAVSQPTATSPRAVVGGAGAIATAAPEASKAGLDALRKGGNAYDAMVAASFVVSVVRPQSTGLGGGGFVVYYDARTQASGAIDGREMAPRGASKSMYVENGKVIEGYRVGPLSAGVPGLVKMLHHLYLTKGSGKLSWNDLVQPARKLAEYGCVVRAPLARAIKKHSQKLARYPASRKIFMPGGKPLREGDRLVQLDLAHTLQTIAAEGADGFYGGWVAEEIAKSNTAAGGVIRSMDLASYRIQARTPIEGSYRGLKVISMPPPSSGGVHLVEMLNMLSHHDLAGMGWHSTRHLHVLAESMRRAFADRAEYMADADFVEVPVAKLIAPGYGKNLSDSIDLQHATPSDEVKPGALFVKEREHTTHISIIDADGNAVASTQTINTALGSLFVAGKSGVLLNNEMNDFTADPSAPNAFGLTQSSKNLPEPKKRPLSSMTPTIVLNADGSVRGVFGSPGGPKIITTVLQTIVNVVDFGMSAEEAVSARRIHHQWKADVLRVEDGVPHGKQLATMGHHVETLGKNRGLGNAQIILIRPDGARAAASDPRGTGRPGAYTQARTPAKGLGAPERDH
jgi:gamma-glutamyltranspeptidase / glutathione hydrolase